MIEAIQEAMKKVEYPFEVRLTPRAIKALRKPENEVHLRQAYVWAQYLLSWDYSRIPGDSPQADYQELLNRVNWAAMPEEARK